MHALEFGRDIGADHDISGIPDHHDERHQNNRRFCEALAASGLLCKETHDNVIRFAPPLIIGTKDLDWAFDRIREVFAKLES